MTKRVTSTMTKAIVLSLVASLVAVPQADAETKTNLEQPLACNLQLKNPRGIPLGLASAVEGVYNAANSQYSNFKVTLDKTEAPSTVNHGQEFDYVIDAGTLGVPAQINAAVTANVSRVSQLNLWYQLPENAELVSFTFEGGAPGMEVQRVGNKLRLWMPAPQGGSQDVATWTKSNRGQFSHGGAEATKAGSTFNIAIPKVTLRLKATGAPGSRIQPGLPKADANTFSSELPIQFYADASASVFLVGNVSANGFIRCGLSEDDSYWPESRRNRTNLPAEKFSAVTIEASAASSYDPKPAGAVTIVQGENLPSAQTQIANFASLPSGTQAAWASTHASAGENQPGRITVTYPDGSTDTVEITVHVKAQWVPRAKTNPTVVQQGGVIADDVAREQIANAEEAPAGTTFEWVTKPDTSKPGEVTGEVKVTVPGRQPQNVTVRYLIQGSDAPEVFVPKVTDDVQRVEVGEAVPEDPRYLITNAAEAPEGTTFQWQTKPDTSAAGNATGTILIQAPNQTPAERTVHFEVVAGFTPQAKTAATEVEVGTVIEDADAAAQIANADQAPQGTTFSWKQKPDTSKPGETTGVVAVQVPGNDPIEVTVRYMVVQTPTGQPTPKLLIRHENGPVFGPGTIVDLKDRKGQTVSITADENGSFVIRESDNLAPNQTVTITGADGKEVRYKFDLEKGTYSRVEYGAEVGTAIAGFILGGVALLGGLTQAPGAREATHGFLNSTVGPQMANAANIALPIISTILGLTGIGLLISAYTPRTNNDGTAVTIGETEFTPVENGSSSLGSS